MDSQPFLCPLSSAFRYPRLLSASTSPNVFFHLLPSSYNICNEIKSHCSGCAIAETAGTAARALPQRGSSSPASSATSTTRTTTRTRRRTGTMRTRRRTRTTRMTATSWTRSRTLRRSHQAAQIRWGSHSFSSELTSRFPGVVMSHRWFPH
jgi:hypothetical protein